MKKTLSISIANILFWIEEDAYQTLDRYLSGIKAHFAGSDEETEIVRDIETRVAEQFLETEKKIITSKEVDAMIAAMGNVKDFGSEPHKNEKAEAPSPDGDRADDFHKPEKGSKRLFRDPDSKILGGVSGGLSAYFNVDVAWIRLAFIVLTFVNGFGILIYIVLWIAMPEAKSVAQRLEMSGTPVTVETIADRVKERVDEVKRDPNTLQRIVAIPFKIIRGILRFIGKTLLPFIGKIFGVFISLGAVFALLGFSVLLGLILTHLGGEYVDFPLAEVISSGTIVVAAFAGYLALAIPFFFLLFLGMALLSRKRMMEMRVLLSLLVVWFVAVIASIVMGVSIGAKVAEYISTNPAYQESEKTLTVTDTFSAIDARNGVNVTYIEGATTSVALLGRAKDLDRMTATVANGMLRLEPKRSEERFCIFCDYGLPKVLVTAPLITNFTGENGTRIGVDQWTSTSTLSITLENGSSGTFAIAAPEVSAKVANASRLTLSGTTTKATLKGENGAYLDTIDLWITNAFVSISNSSRAEIGNTETLDAHARNGGNLRYAGNPVLIKDARSGSEIESSDEDGRVYRSID